MSQTELSLPFHATQSERRLLRNLIGTAAIRKSIAPDALFITALFAELGVVENASAAIAALQEKLFPEEVRLREARAKMLQPLQIYPLRSHFDQSLETAEIGISLKIRNAAEYESVKKTLAGFDFERWQEHCDNERSNAD